LGKLVNAYIMPHPPVIVPGVGEGREMEAAPTLAAMEKAAAEAGKDMPDTIILSSPHAPCFKDYVYIMDPEILAGDFAAFGHPEIKVSFQADRRLARGIAEKANRIGIKAGGLTFGQKQRFSLDDRLDHGALVPLWFLSQTVCEAKLVVLSVPFLTFNELYGFGSCIQDAVRESDGNVVYVASGDLSHRLRETATGGYSSEGAEYDRALVERVAKNDVAGLLQTKESDLEKAGECGARSIVMMYGALAGMDLLPEVYSYEAPWGVGYMIAKLGVNYPESPVLRLVRETLEAYILEGKKINVPRWAPQELRTMRAGAFVSLRSGDVMRGCIGTAVPVQVNLAEEIINNAISAATRDPRFPAVSPKELAKLTYSVYVLGAPERVESIGELDPRRYGVIVTSGFRRGLLLPDLAGVDTPEQQVKLAMQKAGIHASDKIELERFEAVRYG